MVIMSQAVINAEARVTVICVVVPAKYTAKNARSVTAREDASTAGATENRGIEIKD